MVLGSGLLLVMCLCDEGVHSADDNGVLAVGFGDMITHVSYIEEAFQCD